MSNAKDGGLFGLFAGLGFNLFKQIKRQNESAYAEFSYEELLGDLIKGGAMGAGAGLLADFLRGDKNVPGSSLLSKTTYLRYVLKSHDSANFKTEHLYQQIGRELKGRLAEKFGNRIFSPETSGGQRKGLANGNSSDMDILLPFRKASVESPRKAYQEVSTFFESLEKEDERITKVRNQHKSIGVGMEVEDQNLWFDIVPGVENKDFLSDQELILYVAPLYYGEVESTLLTNIYKQEETLVNNSSAREIIRLLKIWRDQAKMDINSFFLQSITEKAFHYHDGKIGKTLFDKLMMTLMFIRDKVQGIRLVDPGNMSNVITEALNPRDRQKIYSVMHEMVKSIEEDAANLHYYFPGKE